MFCIDSRLLYRFGSPGSSTFKSCVISWRQRFERANHRLCNRCSGRRIRRPPALLYRTAPMGPLCVAFSSLTNYAGQHAPLLGAVIVWLLLWTGGWLAMGPRLDASAAKPLHQNPAVGNPMALIGIVVDNTVSFYQYSTTSAESTSGGGSSGVLILSMAERSAIYGIAFAAVVLLSYLLSLTRKPTQTPPPDFGRE